MTTRQELEKMVEEQAGQHQMEEKDRFPQSHAREETLLADARTRSFKSGAAFVMDKLMFEIEILQNRLKETYKANESLIETEKVSFEQISQLKKELTAANERIKELEAEINSLQCECDSGTQCQACFLKEALTPPERGEE